MNIRGYKVFTHDLRSPVQGGAPVWNGSVPCDLPTVAVDTSERECGAGWNFCRDAHVALRIAGLWPSGRPSRLFIVETDDAIERGDKLRSSNLRIVDEVTDLRTAIIALSQAFDSRFRDEMIDEQLAWRAALTRPSRDEDVVKRGIASALEVRGLRWTIRRFDSAGSAWAAMDARDAWDAWAARAARDAWASLIVRYSSRTGWIGHRADLLTVGIRGAYSAGLAIALPTGQSELGWAMEEKP